MIFLKNNLLLRYSRVLNLVWIFTCMWTAQSVHLLFWTPPQFSGERYEIWNTNWFRSSLPETRIPQNNRATPPPLTFEELGIFEFCKARIRYYPCSTLHNFSARTGTSGAFNAKQRLAYTYRNMDSIVKWWSISFPQSWGVYIIYYNSMFVCSLLSRWRIVLYNKSALNSTHNTSRPYHYCKLHCSFCFH